MIEERAVILSVSPSETQSPNRDNHLEKTNIDATDFGIATLEIERKAACGLCGQTRGCGNSLWGKLFAHQSSAFKAQNKINAKVGQVVVVGINEQALLKSAFLLYMLPLATMFLVSILALQVSNNNESAMIGAALGMVLGLVWIKGMTSGRQYFMVNQPEILRLANDVTEVNFIK